MLVYRGTYNDLNCKLFNNAKCKPLIFFVFKMLLCILFLVIQCHLPMCAVQYWKSMTKTCSTTVILLSFTLLLFLQRARNEMCQTIHKLKIFLQFCYTKYQKKNIHYEKPRLRFYIPYMCIFYHIRQKTWWFRSLFLDLVDLNCQVDC